MADEEKMEDVNAETVELEATVDDLIGPKSEGEDAEDTGNQPAEKQEDSHSAGWLTSLPKELRDGIDTSKYSSLKEYIEDLRGNQKEPPATKEEIEEKWAQLEGSVDRENGREEDIRVIDEVIGAMKAEGVSADEARKILNIYGQLGKKIAGSRAENTDKELASYVEKNWGDNRKKYFDDATKGLKVIAGENKELLVLAKSQGLTKNPAFVEVCRMLGSRTSESAIAKESRGGKRDDFDPRNPLRFKH